MRRRTRWILPVLGVVGAAAAVGVAMAGPTRSGSRAGPKASPIEHLVVIFQENVSFDHYFGTYPNAANPPGEPAFNASPDTPSVNGLQGALLTSNPNSGNPQRLDRSQPLTCDQNHGYTAEQKAFDMGLMDKFVQNTNNESCSSPDVSATNLVMDYYDGNTVTGLWNYAQRFAMSDNSYSDTFGPSTPGALNVTAANTYGAICGPSNAVYNNAPNPPTCNAAPGASPATPDSTTATGTVYSDADPNYDICSSTEDHKTAAQTIQMGGQNIGDLLDKAGVTWGWFQGGFASPGYVPGKPSTDDLSAVCTGSHDNVGGASQTDYNPHHEPFQYYASTANPLHKPPTSVAMIGQQDQANHQYDLKDFWAAADSGDLPSVSYLKAADYQDGHAGYSDPLDEQAFIVDTINHLERLPTWHSTAVVVLYDDSDGWYDHQMGPILMQSQTSLDALTGSGACGSNAAEVPTGQGGVLEQARCGVGPRQPLLVISPFSKQNYVDGTLTTQSSVVRFIEDNWLDGERLGNGAEDASAGTLDNMLSFDHPQGPKLFLDPATGDRCVRRPAAGRSRSRCGAARDRRSPRGCGSRS
jgi:phospholipase C